MSRTALLLTVGAIALAAAGCGRRGDLEQPAPLFNERARADYEARRAAQRQQQEDQRNADGTAATRDTAAAPSADSDEDDTDDDFRVPRGDLRDPAQRLEPASRAPIEGGAGNDPFGPPPATRRR
jgi:predicted small lipoprotein YifL